MTSITTAVNIECAAIANAGGIRDESDRLGGVDVLRLAGVCAVVWFHTHAPGAQHLVGQLVALLLVSCTLAVRRTERPFAATLRKRAGRLLVPWAFWWCVYAAVVVLKVLLDGWKFADHFHLRALVGGTSAHLWYIPFVFVAVTLVETLGSFALRLPATAAFIAAAVAGLASLYALSFVWPAVKLPFPFAQHVYALTTIPLGLAIGIARRRMSPDAARTFILLLAATLVAIAVGGLLELWPQADAWPRQQLVQRYAIGTSAFVLALCFTGRAPAFLRRLTPLAMGVYLIHPLMHMFVLQLPIRQASLADGLLTLTLSIAAARLLSHTPLRRFI